MSQRLLEPFWIFLYPLAGVWAFVTRQRRRFFANRERDIPRRKTVIVGNLHSGGSGKTPIVVAIAEHFRDKKPVIVSRGYGATLSQEGAKLDRRLQKGPTLFGDEPWMLSHRLGIPVYIGADRAAILQKAEAETQSDFFLLDDAFQNFSFRHDVDLVAIQTDRRLEQADCIPLGDLREPLSSLSKASAVILAPGEDAVSFQAWKQLLSYRFPQVPVFTATREVEGVWGPDGKVALSQSLQWGAFCAIARPSSFRQSLQATLKPVFFETFPDHHPYTLEDRDFLLKRKAQADAHHLITTEKDWYKAHPLFLEASQALFYLRIRYVFPDEFWYFLKGRLETA